MRKAQTRLLLSLLAILTIGCTPVGPNRTFSEEPTQTEPEETSSKIETPDSKPSEETKDPIESEETSSGESDSSEPITSDSGSGNPGEGEDELPFSGFTETEEPIFYDLRVNDFTPEFPISELSLYIDETVYVAVSPFNHPINGDPFDNRIYIADGSIIEITDGVYSPESEETGGNKEDSEDMFWGFSGYYLKLEPKKVGETSATLYSPTAERFDTLAIAVLPRPEAEEADIKENVIYLSPSQHYQLTYSFDEKDAAYSFSSSDENVATCDQSGLITAIKSGTANINLTSGKAADSVKVVIEDNQALFEYRLVNGGYEIIDYAGDGKEVLLPSGYNGRPVVGIGSGAFAGKNIESVSISENIAYIGKRAFLNCKSLDSVNFTSSLTVGDYAFANCEQFEMFVLPNQITSIGQYAFSGSGIHNSPIFVPKTVQNIGYRGLGDYVEIYSEKGAGLGYYAEATHREIDPEKLIEENGYYYYPFEEGMSLVYSPRKTSVLNLPDEIDDQPIEYIGSLALDYHGAELKLPSQLKGLRATTFPNLTALTLPEGIQELNTVVFTKLSELIVPESVTDLSISIPTDSPIYFKGQEKPWNFSGIGQIYVTGYLDRFIDEESNATFAHTDRGLVLVKGTEATAIKTEVNGEPVTEIIQYACAGNQLLQEVDLSANVRTVGDAAFYLSSVSKAIIGDQVETIGSGAFEVGNPLVIECLFYEDKGWQDWYLDHNTEITYLPLPEENA